MENQAAALPPAREECPTARIQVRGVLGRVSLRRSPEEGKPVKARFMNRQLLGSLLVLGISMAGSLLCQTAKTTATPKKWTQAKTPWGDPDLQGVWPSSSMLMTPLERDPKLGTRNVLTEDEF